MPHSAEGVIRLCDSIRNQSAFTSWKLVTDNRRRLRWREQKVEITGISEQLQSLSPAIAANIDQYRNSLAGADLQVEVFPTGQRPRDQARAQRVENFCYRLFWDLARQRTRAVYAPNERALDYQAADGCGVRHLDWKPDARIVFRSEGDLVASARRAFKDGFTDNPFVLRAPDPMAVYWDRDFSVVCEVGDVQVSSLLSAYDGLSFHPDQGFSFEELRAEPIHEMNSGMWQRTARLYHLEDGHDIYEVAQYQGAGYQASAGQSLLLEHLPNAAGRPRYSFSAGHITSSVEPHKMFRPLVHDLYPVVEELNVLDTLLMSGALNTGRPFLQEVPVGRRPDDVVTALRRPEEERRTIIMDMTSPLLPDAREGHAWQPVAFPSPAQLTEAVRQKQAEVVAFGFPLALSPNFPLQASSGYDRAQQQEASRHFLEPALRNYAAAWHELFTLAMEMLKAVGLPVTIRTIRRAEGESEQEQITIRPEDFQDIEMRVSFRSVPATVEVALQEADERLYQARLLSKTTFMQRRYDDYLREMQQIDLDEMGDLGRELGKQAAAQQLQQVMGSVVQRVNEELGVPQSQEIGPSMGAPAEARRPQRPPGAAMPGVGRPLAPPTQRQPGEAGPPEVREGAAEGSVR